MGNSYNKFTDGEDEQYTDNVQMSTIKDMDLTDALPSPKSEPHSPSKVHKFKSAIHNVIGDRRMEDIKAMLTEKRRILIRALLGEMLCTFIFIFTVLATHVNTVRSSSDSAAITAGVSTGFLSVALIYSFADVSGAHFNPAVTFATMVTKKTSWVKGSLYIGVQLFASIMATVFLFAIFPDRKFVINNVVVTKYDDVNLWNAFATELILTFILVYVIFAVAFDTVDTSSKVKLAIPDEEANQKVAMEVGTQDTSRLGKNLTIYTTNGNSKAGFAPIAIGFTLGFLCFVGGSTSGGAFNPARVFGPCIEC